MSSKSYTPRVESRLSCGAVKNKLRNCNPIDSLSQRSQIICLIICAVTFLALICVLIEAINNPICVEKKRKEKKENLVEPHAPVSMSGLYKLVHTENYVDYLTSLELPLVAASHIDSIKSENISVEEDGQSATIATSTPWISKTISFKFDEPFSVNYGGSESKSKVFIFRENIHFLISSLSFFWTFEPIFFSEKCCEGCAELFLS